MTLGFIIATQWLWWLPRVRMVRRGREWWCWLEWLCFWVIASSTVAEASREWKPRRPNVREYSLALKEESRA